MGTGEPAHDGPAPGGQWPETRPRPPLSPTTERAVGRISELAAGVAARIDPVTDRLVHLIKVDDAGYGTRDLVPDGDLWRSCHDNLLEILDAIAQVPDARSYGTAAPHATGRRRAEQRLPLESLLHAYRVGGRVVWESLLEECRTRTPPPIDELMDGAVFVWEVIDFYSTAVAQAYRQAEAELLGRDEARRQTLLRSLLSGVALDTDIAFAAEILQLPASGPYLVAVADPHGHGSTSTRSLAAALRAQGIASEWLMQDGRFVGLIALGRLTASHVASQLLAAGRMRLGLSPTTNELAAVATAYRHAELALRCVPAGKLEAASIDDRPISALLVASPDLARRLSQRVLGPVLALVQDERDLLLRTLDAYIEVSGAMATVAAHLSCHRNTVLSRLARIEQLTGTSLSNRHDLVLLTAAVRAAQLLPVDPPVEGPRSGRRAPRAHRQPSDDDIGPMVG